jgi:hypothetical protein
LNPEENFENSLEEDLISLGSMTNQFAICKKKKNGYVLLNPHILHSLPNSIEIMKSRRMRWRGLIARMGGKEIHRNLWYENLKEKDN